MLRISLILLFVLPWIGDGARFGEGEREGRRGNALYHQELYEEAATMYRDGLGTIAADALGTIPAGLLNNLGAALYRSGDFEGATGALAASLDRALEPSDISRAAYNQGNAAFKAEQLEQSLASYRKALMTNPEDADARFNYEFVKRKLEEQQQEDQEQDQEQNDDEQDQEQQQQDQQQNDEEQNQEQQEQQQQDQQQQEQQQQEQQQDQTEMSPQEAQRILEALENEEEQLLRQVQKMKTRPRRVEKDW